MAADLGMDGIVVSNHGGRQVDGAIASLTVLPEIVDAVGDRLTILFDSGIRSGTDIIKALSLGAKAVLLGRPWVYGMGIAGKEGAKEVIQGILADFDQSMCLSGFKSISELDRTVVQNIVYTICT
jgi:isopentenyl diphosphate isomerase/L-lactate dehydrogenase-like FMN-dependent dehydrogenase